MPAEPAGLAAAGGTAIGGIGAGGWAALAVGALLVGFAKTAVGGVGPISAALFAAVLPARESTGALLPLLMVGDLLAVGTYRGHADRALLLRLFPSVAVGILVGVVFVARVDDTVMRRTIGAVLLGLVAVHLGQRRASRDREPVRPGRVAAVCFGALAGFTTMVANAGGPVMSLYLLASNLTVLGFLGTGAWFFALVNLFKLPFSIGLGLVGPGSLTLTAVLVPAVVLGALAGRLLASRLDRRRFETVVLAATVLASANLLR